MGFWMAILEGKIQKLVWATHAPIMIVRKHSVFIWVLPEVDPEIRILVEIVYLGTGEKNIGKRDREERTLKESVIKQLWLWAMELNSTEEVLGASLKQTSKNLINSSWSLAESWWELLIPRHFLFIIGKAKFPRDRYHFQERPKIWVGNWQHQNQFCF